MQDHLKLLHQRGVAYLNMDYAAVSNYTLAIGTSPLLQDVLYAVANQVILGFFFFFETLFCFVFFMV